MSKNNTTDKVNTFRKVADKFDLVGEAQIIGGSLQKSYAGSTIDSAMDTIDRLRKQKAMRASMITSGIARENFNRLPYPDPDNKGVRYPTYSYSECYNALAQMLQLITYVGIDTAYEQLCIGYKNTEVTMSFVDKEDGNDHITDIFRRTVAYHLFTGEPVVIYTDIPSNILGNSLDMVILDMCKTLGCLFPNIRDNIQFEDKNPWHDHLYKNLNQNVMPKYSNSIPQPFNHYPDPSSMFTGKPNEKEPR